MVSSNLKIENIGVIGAGTMGPVCAKLQKMYDEAVRGGLDGYETWLDYIYDESPKNANKAT